MSAFGFSTQLFDQIKKKVIQDNVQTLLTHVIVTLNTHVGQILISKPNI